MIKSDRNGVFLFREEGYKVDSVLIAVIVLDWESVVGVRIDVLFTCSPDGCACVSDAVWRAMAGNELIAKS